MHEDENCTEKVDGNLSKQLRRSVIFLCFKSLRKVLPYDCGHVLKQLSCELWKILIHIGTELVNR